MVTLRTVTVYVCVCLSEWRSVCRGHAYHQECPSIYNMYMAMVFHVLARCGACPKSEDDAGRSVPAGIIFWRLYVRRRLVCWLVWSGLVWSARGLSSASSRRYRWYIYHYRDIIGIITIVTAMIKVLDLSFD